MKKILSAFLILTQLACAWGENKACKYCFVDLSKFANASVSDGVAPVKNLPAMAKNGIVEFNTIKFKLPDESQNGGKSVLSFDSKDEREIEIELPKNKLDGIFTLYILANVELGEKKACENDKLRMQLFNSFGYLVSYAYPKAAYGFGDSARADDCDFAKCVYLDNPEKKSGAIYMFSARASNHEKFVPTLLKLKWFGDKKINIFAITLSEKFVDCSKSFDFVKNDWRAVDLSNLTIADGSVLDVSESMGEKPAGKYGRVVVRNGRFEFENKPDVRVKFKSTNWRPSNHFNRDLKTKEDIDAIVSKARAQGYNMIRWRLCPETDGYIVAPYEYEKSAMDKYDYFLYACGREGVYSHLMLSSHLFGTMDENWKNRFDIKIKFLFGDPETRMQWRKMAFTLLNHVNPYTGLAWKDDPSIATSEYFNELDTIYSLHRGLTEVGRDYCQKYIQKRLEKKYGTIDKLNAAWKPQKPFEDFSQIKPLSNKPHFDMCEVDFSEILVERSRDMQKFCEKVVKEEIGFKAPIHQHNCAMRMDVFQSSFEMGDYIAQNTYAAPQNGLMKPGSSNDPSDWLLPDQFGHWFLYAAMKRVAGMPFGVSEFQYRHWNRHKYEAGVFYSAYAAFQDFDMLTIHDVALASKPRGRLDNFSVNNSPVFRANEFLNYCLFYRGDVSPALHRVEIDYDKSAMNSKYGARCMSFERAKTAFMTGFTVSYPDSPKPAPKAKPADLNIKPDGYSAAIRFANRTFLQEDVKESASTFAKKLRALSILPKDNISEPADGVYQTDTGEITMRMKEAFVKVCTPRTEAAALKPNTKNERLKNLLIKSVSTPSAVSVSSMDGNPIEKSSRLVMTFNTDNINTGFKISTDRRILKEAGRLPVLVKTGKLSAELKLDPSKNFDVYALNIRGERLQKLSFPVENGVMKINLDTSKLEKEPSVFYEIAAR